MALSVESAFYVLHAAIAGLCRTAETNPGIETTRAVIAVEIASDQLLKALQAAGLIDPDQP